MRTGQFKSLRSGLLFCLTAVICSQFSVSLHGQDSTTYKAFYIGALGGAGYYHTIFNPGLRGDAGGVAPVFGAAIRFESPRRKSIELELRYRRGGWKEAEVYERNMQVLEIPVMGNIAIGKGKFKPFITLGETITYVLSEEEVLTDPDYTPYFSDKPVSNKWGFALNGGLGILRQAAKSVIQLEFRATFQVTNIYNPDDEEIRELGLSSSLPVFFEANVKYLFKVL